MTRLHTPRPKGRNVVGCNAEGCAEWGIARPDWDAGKVFPKPPAGWGYADGWALNSDGREVPMRYFVCSRACARRLSMGLVKPSLGNLD